MTPPIINEAGTLLARYDVLFCDVWGVVHNGRRAYAEAGLALARFRAGGGTVILVSNAPVPAAGVAHILAVTGARCDAFDAIVSSGDIALGHIRDQGYRRLHRVGPLKRDQLFFDGLPGPHAALDAADAIACTGLADERRETVADYRALIDGGLRRGLPFVCANPDLVVDVGHERLVCAGSLAAVYEREGGAVFWAGKPHPSAYGAALAAATRLRGTEPARASSASATRCAPTWRRPRALVSMGCSSWPASTATIRCATGCRIPRSWRGCSNQARRRRWRR